MAEGPPGLTSEETDEAMARTRAKAPAPHSLPLVPGSRGQAGHQCFAVRPRQAPTVPVCRHVVGPVPHSADRLQLPLAGPEWGQHLGE